MRFHLLAVPHTISTPHYSSCAFTQKVVKLAAMLTGLGHQVFHYGHQDSDVQADNIPVTTQTDLETSYPGHDWTTGWPPYQLADPIYQTFYTNTNRELAHRKQPGDFLLCAFGAGHQPIAQANPDMIVVEPGIGYPGGGFAPFRVFESYSTLHAYRGTQFIAEGTNDLWYDAVIPNYYNPHDFTYSDTKHDYLLFLGRVNTGKGIHIALDAAKQTRQRLIVAGPGSLDGFDADHATHVGCVNPTQRATLLSRAKALIAPSIYLEPFCGVHVEAMLSGTPVITTDWGAFAEYNLHGVTGYRCRTFEHFTWAINNIHRIRPADCRDWAVNNFSMTRVADMYQEYFTSVAHIFGGQGWYQPNPDRTELDWLTKQFPRSRT